MKPSPFVPIFVGLLVLGLGMTGLVKREYQLKMPEPSGSGQHCQRYAGNPT